MIARALSLALLLSPVAGHAEEGALPSLSAVAAAQAVADTMSAERAGDLVYAALLAYDAANTPDCLVADSEMQSAWLAMSGAIARDVTKDPNLDRVLQILTDGGAMEHPALRQDELAQPLLTLLEQIDRLVGQAGPVIFDKDLVAVDGDGALMLKQDCR